MREQGLHGESRDEGLVKRLRDGRGREMKRKGGN